MLKAYLVTLVAFMVVVLNPLSRASSEVSMSTTNLGKKHALTASLKPQAELDLSYPECDQYLHLAGIIVTQPVIDLIKSESNCHTASVNPTSGACGIAQEWPCGKSGCSRTDAVCQLKWMQAYTLDRYGSWSNAWAFHIANNFY